MNLVQLSFLTLPSAVIFGLLIWHSLKTLGRKPALVFWASVSIYGLLRGIFVHWVTSQALGSPSPYVIHNPALKIFGVALQEVLGWGIVAYLGWWLGDAFCNRFMKSDRGRVFVSTLWAFSFLGAISLAIEAVAVGAGWWHWEIRNYSFFYDNVPMVGLLDWAFVAFDFLLPYLIWRAGKEHFSWSIRLISLTLFPLHFLAHCFVNPISSWLPFSPYALGHWLIFLFALWGALQLGSQKQIWQDKAKSFVDQLPKLSIGLLLGSLFFAHMFVIRDAGLLPTLTPVLVIIFLARKPLWGNILAPMSLVLSLVKAVFAPASFPWLAAWSFRQFFKLQKLTIYLLLGSFLLAGIFYDVHRHRRTTKFVAGLEMALSYRDQGLLNRAMKNLRQLNDLYPDQHSSRMILGEMLYKTGQHAEARGVFLEMVNIKQSAYEGYQYLGILALLKADFDQASEFAEMGLSFQPENTTLQYINHVTQTPEEVFLASPSSEPGTLFSLHSLALQLNHPEHAIALLSQAIKKYPKEPRFYSALVKIAQSRGDKTLARQTALAWQESIPEDPQARAAVESLFSKNSDEQDGT